MRGIQNDLYTLKVRIDSNVPENALKEANNFKIDNDDLWHRRFCYVSNKKLKKLADASRVTGLGSTRMDKYTCEACCIGKATKTACRKLKSRQTKEICE